MLSTIAITQQLNSIAKPYPENIDKLTFYNTNRKDMRTILDDYLNGVDRKETTDIINRLKINKYARLEINLRHPYNCEVIIPQI